MKKIGIVTWFISYNYGTCLQCFALTKYLSDRGYETYVPEKYVYYYGLNHPVETFKKVVDLIYKKLNKPNQIVTISKELKPFADKRLEKNTKFVYEENNIFLIHKRTDYKKLLINTDVFISGSDQIWNPNYVTPPMLLAFANDKHKRIAYASSIGVDFIPKKKEGLYKKYLSKFDYIGLRERTAKNVIANLTEKPIQIVADPTFLLQEKQWIQIAQKYTEKVPKENYIFCYFIGDDRIWESDADNFAAKYNLKIISALSESNIVPEVGEIVPDAGVGDFVSLIANADYIMTDSYHAMALSINLNKQFAAYKRFSETNNESQNSRVIDLLRLYNLSNRIISLDRNICTCLNEKINYEYINLITEEWRKKSEEFLLNAIEE